MATIPNTVIVSVALLAAAWSSSDAWAQSALRDRVAGAIETVERGCAGDIEKFCDKVTRGEGRLLLCMQAHEDQLSRRCQFAVYRVSRNLERAINRVERIADACWTDIEAQCGDAEKIGQCVVQKKASLSQSCQTVIGSLQQAVQGLASLRGMPVYSSDDKDLGKVVDVARGPDGKIQSIQVEVGRFLGLGNRAVTINADAIEQLADRVRLRMAGDQFVHCPRQNDDHTTPSLTRPRRGFGRMAPSPSAPKEAPCARKSASRFLPATRGESSPRAGSALSAANIGENLNS